MIATAEQTSVVPVAGEIPAPGIYEGVPFETYLSWPVLSNSRLSAADRSMLHFKYQEPIEETPQMRLGTLCHTGRLEPSAIYRRYVVMPDLTRNIVLSNGEPAKNPKATAEYARRVDDWRSQQGELIVVSQDEFDSMAAVVSALDSHPVAHKWFSAEGPVELSIVWDDQDTGIRLKGRIDKVAFAHAILADLKTTRDCLRFPSQIADRKYYKQGAIYLDGWKTLTGESFRFGLVAVENTKPVGVMAAPIRDQDIAQGRDEYKRALESIAESRSTGVWPGYESPDEWALPSWAVKNEASESITLTMNGAKVVL